MAPPSAQCDSVPLSALLLRHIYILNSVLERAGNRCADEHNLTIPQWMALGCIGHGGAEGVTHSELGNRLMLSKAPITGVVDRLERDGHVKRVDDAKDRRVSRIVMTPAGEEIWFRVRKSLHSCAEEYCRCLEPDEMETVVGALGRMLDSAAEKDPHLATLHAGTHKAGVK
ncbi:MAG TPA: MarR family transcriptional regulator [Abditibacteriaceae bacterium]|jgi:MarR family 2-MHQ and catechol resistance regulon transcriptional repressor